MRSLIKKGYRPITSAVNESSQEKWTTKEKLLLGLTPKEYLNQAIKNPFNWILGLVFVVGIPVIIYRF